MSATASQITCLMIVYPTVYSGANQRKHQSSASLAFVRRIHRWPVNSPHKGLVTRKMFYLITSSCKYNTIAYSTTMVKGIKVHALKSELWPIFPLYGDTIAMPIISTMEPYLETGKISPKHAHWCFIGMVIANQNDLTLFDWQPRIENHSSMRCFVQVSLF